MTKPESRNELSQNGKARKEAMLDRLQDELVSIHHKRRQRRLAVKGIALATIVVIAGLASSFLISQPEFENHVAEGTAEPSATRWTVASVGNLDGIDARCVVANANSSASFEALADDELLAMLAAVGQPSVLGEINGKVRVIPDVAPQRKKAKPL